jgi:hypothetical protein
VAAEEEALADVLPAAEFADEDGGGAGEAAAGVAADPGADEAEVDADAGGDAGVGACGVGGLGAETPAVLEPRPSF